MESKIRVNFESTEDVGIVTHCFLRIKEKSTELARNKVNESIGIVLESDEKKKMFTLS